jgi:hypothetical protein
MVVNDKGTKADTKGSSGGGERSEGSSACFPGNRSRSKRPYVLAIGRARMGRWTFRSSRKEEKARSEGRGLLFREETPVPNAWTEIWMASRFQPILPTTTNPSPNFLLLSRPERTMSWFSKFNIPISSDYKIVRWPHRVLPAWPFPFLPSPSS